MDNSSELFSIALGLTSPWSIQELTFNKETSQLDIYLREKCMNTMFKQNISLLIIFFQVQLFLVKFHLKEEAMLITKETHTKGLLKTKIG